MSVLLHRLSVAACIAATSFGIQQAVADTILVPSEVPTIQEAIDFAVDGDTVLVARGTYVESINFLGKAITVTSEEGPEATIIDGDATDAVVKFVSGEGRDSVLNGFTVQHVAITPFGGGISIISSSPTIVRNIIRENLTNGDGAGIRILFSSPLIQDNIISNNVGRFGGRGGGIWIRGGRAKILDNIISDNSISAPGKGGGIFIDSMDFGGLIRGNLISGNIVTGSQSSAIGGGINIRLSRASIVQNLIVGNSAVKGGGFALDTPSTTTLLVINNTIADNNADFGSGFYSDGSNSGSRLINNIIVGAEGETAFFCGVLGFNTPIMKFNNVFGPMGIDFGGECIDPTGTEGNISEDPFFVDAANGDYRLQVDSPSIDSGDNTAPNLPVLDLDGNPRIFDGDGDSLAEVDMGVFEFGSHPPVPDLIIDLIDAVIVLGLHTGIEKRLLDDLDAALVKLLDGNDANDGAAIGMLRGFIDDVDARRGNQITDADADELVAAAEEIISILQVA